MNPSKMSENSETVECPHCKKQITLETNDAASSKEFYLFGGAFLFLGMICLWWMVSGIDFSNAESGKAIFKAARVVAISLITAWLLARAVRGLCRNRNGRMLVLFSIFWAGIMVGCAYLVRLS